MVTRAWALAGCVLSGILAGACTAEPPPSAPGYTPPVTQSPRQPVSLQSLVAAVLADAAGRSGRPVEALQVASAEAVTWSDGSLGCPQPGMMYTQALVPGYRIRIEVDGQVLDYHAGQHGGFVLCPPGLSVEPVGRDEAI